MISLDRLGLGCMGMSSRRNSENSIKTIHKALDSGITLFNTGEFYNAGESEMIVGRAMQGIPRDSYFLSVKFGVLPQPGVVFMGWTSSRSTSKDILLIRLQGSVWITLTSISLLVRT